MTRLMAQGLQAPHRETQVDPTRGKTHNTSTKFHGGKTLRPKSIVLIRCLSSKKYDAIMNPPPTNFFELSRRLGGYFQGSLPGYPTHWFKLLGSVHLDYQAIIIQPIKRI
jgi:hypothetical protein